MARPPRADHALRSPQRAAASLLTFRAWFLQDSYEQDGPPLGSGAFSVVVPVKHRVTGAQFGRGLRNALPILNPGGADREVACSSQGGNSLRRSSRLVARRWRRVSPLLPALPPASRATPYANSIFAVTAGAIRPHPPPRLVYPRSFRWRPQPSSHKRTSRLLSAPTPDTVLSPRKLFQRRTRSGSAQRSPRPRRTTSSATRRSSPCSRCTWSARASAWRARHPNRQIPSNLLHPYPCPIR